VFLLSIQGAGAVGIYAAAAKLMKVTTYFSKAFCDALYPIMSRQAVLVDGNVLARTYRQSVKWVMIVIVPFIVLATVESRSIMRTLYGPEFVAASFVFQIFAWRAGLGFFTQLCGTTLFAMERQALVFKATGIGAIASVLLYTFLIPQYSYAGAAFSLLGAVLIEFLLQVIFVHQRLKTASIRAHIIKPVAAGIVMAGFCAFFNFVPVFPLAALGFLLYGATLIMLGVISRDEVEMLWHAVLTMLQSKTVREVYK
jgi:O-antigen/teichoic acid export membrane protein